MIYRIEPKHTGYQIEIANVSEASRGDADVAWRGVSGWETREEAEAELARLIPTTTAIARVSAILTGDMVTVEAIPDTWSFGQCLHGRPAARGKVAEVGPMPGLWPEGPPVGVLARWSPMDGSEPYDGWVGVEQVSPC